MSKKLADYTLLGKLTQAAIGEEFQSVVASTSDAIRADNTLKQATGKEGIKWVGGKQRGGAGQKAIKPTYDIAKAGYNILNKQSVTSDAAVNAGSCSGALCKKYKTSAEAAEAVVKVLGDRALRTCASVSECSSGGLENEPGTSTPGEGFSPMLEKTTKENLE